jgi:hypothetical protein
MVLEAVISKAKSLLTPQKKRSADKACQSLWVEHYHLMAAPVSQKSVPMSVELEGLALN